MYKITSVFNLLLIQIKALKTWLIRYENKYRRQSFSQSGEDLIIDFIFIQLGILMPTYIDIGAHHPFYLSNSAIFYGKGCRGINIEPDATLFNLFPKHRKKDTNLNCGIGFQDGELLLNIMSEPTLNTFSEDEAQRLVRENNLSIIKKVRVPILSINTIIKKFANNVFPDLLSLDVEGLDIEVIKSIDYNLSKPIVICVETISYSQKGTGEKDTEIAKFLIEHGYLLYADTNINSIFVLKEKWVKQ